jgi:N-hydroxyarylamine O-acetyltransferase
LNLDAYLERIRWRGELRVDLATLTGLLRAHVLHIPFDNLDVLLRRPIRIDLEGLQQKLVGSRRGGYCFEHASLFAAVLESIGFDPVRHSARVVLFAPPSVAASTHMYLTVPLDDGEFVVDPGFGPYASRAPLRVADGSESIVGDETHWLVRNGRHWTLRAKIGDEARDAWISTMEPANLVDFEIANYYMSTHPKSGMAGLLMMCALKPDGRVTVLNRELTIRHAGERRSTQLADRAALRAVLVEQFGFDLPEIERVRIPAIPEWGQGPVA